MTAYYIMDRTRAFITIAGQDRFDFLQGLISNDVEKCRTGRAIWTAILTPQGKFLYDFFVFPRKQLLIVDCHKDEMMPLGQLLRKYQLRSEIQIAIDSEASAVLLLDGEGDEQTESAIPEKKMPLKEISGEVTAIEGGVLYDDPRCRELGVRFVGDAAVFLKNHPHMTAKSKEYYEAGRIQAGIPDGRFDIEKNKGLLLEYGFDALHGIDWEKGCYMGQELTARTKYRALIKKRLMLVKPATGVFTNIVKSGAKILAAEKEIGEIRSVSKNVALAFIRMDRMEKAQTEKIPCSVHGLEVLIENPRWFTNSQST